MKLHYIKPTAEDIVLNIQHNIMQPSASGFNNNPGFSDDDPEEDPRSKQRIEGEAGTSYGNLW